MPRFVAVHHETLAIEADTAAEAFEQFAYYLDALSQYSITIYDEDTKEDVTP